jgi:hypothetical protein
MEDKNVLDDMFALMDETADQREDLSSDSNSDNVMELNLKPLSELDKDEREYPAGYQPLTPCSNHEFEDSRGRKYYMAMDRSLRRIR